MKTIMSLVVAFALTLSVIPAMAGDTFQAFSKMSTDEQTRLTVLADTELEVIEGGQVCAVCTNVAVGVQRNLNIAGNALQANVSSVRQRIN